MKVEGSRFKRRGLLTRRERISLFLGAPLLLVVLSVTVVRIYRAVLGEPLHITSIIGPDLTVEWSSNPYLFLLALGFYFVVVLILAVVLWFQLHEARRWLRSRR
jgi:hypothetical protein